MGDASREIVTAISAGHGGSNHGAEHGGLIEKDMTLAVCEAAWRMRPELLMLRIGDETASHTLRNRRAERADVRLVQEVHFNAVDPNISWKWAYDQAIKLGRSDYEARGAGERARAEAPRRKGLRANYWAGSHGAITRDLARAATQAAPRELRPTRIFDHREATENVRNVLGAYSAPTLLLECGFLTNHENATYIRTTEGIEAIARVLLAVDDRFRAIMGA